MAPHGSDLNPTARAWPSSQYEPVRSSSSSSKLSKPHPALTITTAPSGNNLNPNASIWFPRTLEDPARNSNSSVPLSPAAAPFHLMPQQQQHQQQPPEGSQMSFAYYDNHFGPLYYISRGPPTIQPQYATFYPTMQQHDHLQGPHGYQHQPHQMQPACYIPPHMREGNPAMNEVDGTTVASKEVSEKAPQKKAG